MLRGIGRVILFTSIVLTAASLSAQNVTISEIADNLICQCGSNMVVTSCQCGTASKMKKEIGEMLNNGKTEQEIYDSFIEQYGQKVMAAPPKEGFYYTAWFTPFIGIFSVGLLIIITLRRWSKKKEVDSDYGENEENLSEDEIKRNEGYYENKLDEELRNF